MKELRQLTITSILTLGIIALAALLIVIWFIYAQANTVINSELDRRILTSVSSIRELVGNDLKFDKQEVFEALNRQRRDQDLNKICVFDVNRRSLADSNPTINKETEKTYTRLELPYDVATEVLAGEVYWNQSYKFAPGQPSVRAFGFPLWDKNADVIGGIIGFAEPKFETPLNRIFKTFLIAAGLTALIIALLFGGLAGLIRRYAKFQKNIEQRSRIDFIHMLSTGIMHEIKTPLATIDGSGQLLSSRLAGEEENAELANYIVTEAGRIKEIIDHSLGAGKATELKVLAVKPVVEHVLRLLSISARRKNVTVHCDVKSDTHVNASVLMMRLIYSNIIANAIQIVEEKTGEVVVSEVHAPGKIGIKISDNGPGISRSMLKTLFEPMSSERKGGSGFGLAVAHQTVREMKGSIEMDTKLGKGTSFTIWLPTVPAPDISEIPSVLKS